MPILPEPKCDTDIRMALAEGGQMRNDEVSADQARGGDRQKPARAFAFKPQHILRLYAVVEQSSCVW